MNNNIEVLNYCAHAIDGLRTDAEIIRRVMPLSAFAYSRICELLERSVKFILPNRCELLDLGELKQSHLDRVKLPYPVVAFEAPWEDRGDLRPIGGMPQLAATKRIALCWEADPNYELLPGMNSMIARSPSGGIFVLPIFWGPEFVSWTVGMGGMFFPYGSDITVVGQDAHPVSKIFKEAMIGAGRVSGKSPAYNAVPFIVLPELFAHRTVELGSQDRAFAQIAIDASDEMYMLIQACSVIDRANATTMDVAAPEMLNKKREAKGKQPFFSYKVLQLAEGHQKNTESSLEARTLAPEHTIVEAICDGSP